MTRIGCTGHQNLGPVTRRLVASSITGHLTRLDDVELIGLTSLAEGADQIFAHTVLAAGGRLHAIRPCDHYESAFSSPEASHTYTRLLALATNISTLPYPEPNEDAFLAAGMKVVDDSDLLLAVWDGAPAAGKGGTADIVAYARHHGTIVHIIWPEGARRG